jgi:hypothetical protein
MAAVAMASEVLDKKALLTIHSIATSEPFSFLYVKLTTRDPNKMFMIKFSSYIQIE